MLSSILREHRVIQAPMAGVQGTELTAAVCTAGGIGSLPAAMLDSDSLLRSLQKLSDAVSTPYNVNFFCHQAEPADAPTLQRWRDSLQPYYAELGVHTEAAAGAGRRPFDAEALAQLRRAPPALVSFHFGLPEPALLSELKALGCAVLGCATSVDEALWLQARAVDAVIAQGEQAGGHQGNFLQLMPEHSSDTLSLVRAMRGALQVPIIAAGGIATRADAQAAMRAGASAVQAGSAYLQADEASTSALHRRALQSAAARDTALSNVFTGRRARGIVNRLMRERGPIAAQVPVFPHAAHAIAPLRAAAEALDSADFSPFWSGTRGYLSQATSAANITRELSPR